MTNFSGGIWVCLIIIMCAQISQCSDSHSNRRVIAEIGKKLAEQK